MDLKFKIGNTEAITTATKEAGSILIDTEKENIQLDKDAETRITLSIGEKTPEGGEIFTTYDEKTYTDLPYSSTVGTINKNEIISEHATAFGSNNVSGCRAFKMTSCNENNKTYTFTIGALTEQEKKLLQTAKYYATWLFTNDTRGDNRAEMVDGVNKIDIDDSNAVATVTVSYFQGLETGANHRIDATESYIRFYDENYQPIMLGTDSIEGWSFVTGMNNKALGMNSFATGKNNVADGTNSFVTGNGNKTGYVSLAAGRKNRVKQYGAVFGESNVVTGAYSFASGRENEASGKTTHAEGNHNHAIGMHSHVEGEYNKTEGQASHAEGSNTIAKGMCSHTEGTYTQASGQNAHAEGHGQSGNPVEASSTGAHAEGIRTKSLGAGSHSEGADTKAAGNRAHAEGNATYAIGIASHAEGTGNGSTSSGAVQINFGAFGNFSHSEGNQTKSEGDASHAEGKLTVAKGYGSHAEGEQTSALKRGTHAEGFNTLAEGDSAHAEGYATKAKGIGSHAEGYGTIAQNDYSYAGGSFNRITKPDTAIPITEGVVDGRSKNITIGNNYVQWNLNDTNGANHYCFKYLFNKGTAYKLKFICEFESETLASTEGLQTDCWGWEDINTINGDGNKELISKAQNIDVKLEKLDTNIIELQVTTKTYQYIGIRFYNSSAIAGNLKLVSAYIVNEEIDTDIIHSVGNGTSETDRKNAFVVYKDGHAEVQTMGDTDNSVVTKGYVDQLLAKITALETQIANLTS